MSESEKCGADCHGNPDHGRIAIREQGAYLIAYWARETTMDGTTVIASVHRRFAEEFPELFEEWKRFIQRCMEKAFAATGTSAGGWTDVAAPEHERAGNA